MTEQLFVRDRFFQAEEDMNDKLRYLLPSATEQEIQNWIGDPQCESTSPNGWCCTQPSFHRGIHVACDGQVIVAQWPNDDEPPYTIAEEPV